MLKSSQNYKTKSRYEFINGTSKTLPNETYTIRELLEKHTRGIMPPNLDREGQYQEDADFDSIDYQKVNRMDIVDKQEIKNYNQLSIDDIIEEERIKTIQKNEKLKAEAQAKALVKEKEESDEGTKAPIDDSAKA